MLKFKCYCSWKRYACLLTAEEEYLFINCVKVVINKLQLTNSDTGVRPIYPVDGKCIV